jgi:Ca-activated chloride channel family protein
MFKFAQPYSFLLLPAVALAAWLMFRGRIATGLLYAPTGRIPAGRRSWRAAAALALSVLFVAGLVLAVIALARPQTVLSTSRRKADVIAIEMVVDVSGSMEALDMSDIAGNQIVRERTRLDVVKQAFADFIGKRPDDLAGLVTFGGFASTRAPLTADHAALLHVLKGVELPRPFQDGSGRVVNDEELLTAVGDGLATACARLEYAEPKSKIIVLLSDGESNTGVVKPDLAAETAKKMGIRVYTIGVGTTGRAPVRTRDMLGRPVVGLADVTLDEELLRKIALTTGGQYFNVRDPRGLQRALDAINQLEKTAVERNVYNQYNELFGWFLMPAVGLLLAATGLGVMVTGRAV